MINTSHQNLQFSYYTPAMYEEFKNTMQICFQDMGGEYASEEEMQLLHDLYPRGQIVARDGETIAGAIICRIVEYDTYCKAHTQAQVLDLAAYVPDSKVGNAIYSMDVFVHPNYRSMKLGNVLYYKLVDEITVDNFSHLMGASLVSSYSKYADKMSLEEYIENIKNKTLKDSSLNFHLYNGMEILDIMENFNPHDLSSSGCGVALGYKIPSYNPNLPTFKERAEQLKKFLVHE